MVHRPIGGDVNFIFFIPLRFPIVFRTIFETLIVLFAVLVFKFGISLRFNGLDL